MEASGRAVPWTGEVDTEEPQCARISIGDWGSVGSIREQGISGSSSSRSVFFLPGEAPLLLLLFSGASVSQSTTQASWGRFRVWGSWWAGTIPAESPPMDCRVKTVREQKGLQRRSPGLDPWGCERVWGEDCGQRVCVP